MRVKWIILALVVLLRGCTQQAGVAPSQQNHTTLSRKSR